MNVRKTLGCLLLAACAAAGHAAVAPDKAPASLSSGAVANSDAQAIAVAMKALFDKPQAPLSVAPVSIEGDFAVVGWLQAERGGRALLRKDAGNWMIVACGGDGLKQAAVLSQAGLTQASAERLARSVEQAESKLPAEQVKKFSLFGAMVPLDHRHGDSSGAHHP
jgi:hypothetical protein